MSAAISPVLLAVLVLAAAGFVALPAFRFHPEPNEAPALAASEEARARLLAGLQELARDRKAQMVSDADYTAAVREIRRQLARL